MPQIPVFQQSVVLSPAPAGVDINPERFGKIGETVANIGATAVDFTSKLQDMRDKADDATAAGQQSGADLLAADKVVEDAKLNAPSDYKGYAASVSKGLDDLFRAGQKNMDSEEARLLYEHSMRPIFEKYALDAQHGERQQFVKSSVQSDSDFGDTLANKLTTSPSLQGAYDGLDVGKQTIKTKQGTVYNEDAVRTQSDALHAKAAVGQLDGLLQRGNGDAQNGLTFIQQGLDILDSKDAISQTKPEGERLVDGLTPEKKYEYYTKFNTALHGQIRANNAELFSRYNDAVNNAKLGMPISQTILSDLQKVASTPNSGVTPEEGFRMKTELVRSVKLGQTVAQAQVTSPDEWQGILNSLKNKTSQVAAQNPDMKAATEPGFDSVHLSNDENFLKAHMAQIATARAQDIVAYTYGAFPPLAKQVQAAGNDPQSTQAAIKSLLARQDQLGVAKIDQRVTSNQLAGQIAQGIKSADEQQATNQFSVYEQKYGKYFQNVLNEMIDQKALDPKYAFAALVPDPTARQQVMGNIINGPAIQKAFQESHPAETASNDLKKATLAAARPYLNAMIQTSAAGGSTERANAFQDVLNIDAMNRMNHGESQDDAVTHAVQILQRNMANHQTAGSNVNVPHFVAGVPINQPLVRAFMDSHLQPDALKEASVKVPLGQITETPPPGAGFEKLGTINYLYKAFSETEKLGYDHLSPADKEARFYGAIQKYGSMVNNAAGDGMRLQLNLPSGKTVPVLGQDNRPIEWKFTDISGNPDKRTLDQVGKSNWQVIPAAVNGVTKAIKVTHPGPTIQTPPGAGK